METVEREFGNYVTFFPSAPPGAVAALSPQAAGTKAETENPLGSVVAALNAQLDAIPGLADAVESLMKQRVSHTAV